LLSGLTPEIFCAKRFFRSTIAVCGDRIVAAEPAARDARRDAQRSIDAAGKYAIPGRREIPAVR